MPEFFLGINTATFIELDINPDFKRDDDQKRSDARGRSGNLFITRWAIINAFKFSLEYVPAADAAIINSWWSTNTELLFLVTSSTATEVNSIMIMNKKRPLAQFNAPYDNLYKGAIILEER